MLARSRLAGERRVEVVARRDVGRVKGTLTTRRRRSGIPGAVAHTSASAVLYSFDPRLHCGAPLDVRPAWCSIGLASIDWQILSSPHVSRALELPLLTLYSVRRFGTLARKIFRGASVGFAANVGERGLDVGPEGRGGRHLARRPGAGVIRADLDGHVVGALRRPPSRLRVQRAGQCPGDRVVGGDGRGVAPFAALIMRRCEQHRRCSCRWTSCWRGSPRSELHDISA